jgi:hypothetical protein
MFELAVPPAPEHGDNELDDDDGDDAGGSVASPAGDARRRTQGSTPEVLIDPALLADRQAADSLANALATSSASILVSDRVMLSTYRLPEAVYGRRPAIPAIDRDITRKPKANSRAAMSAQIDELKQALEASFAREDQSRDTFDAQAAQLGLAGMLVNKSQFQLANAEERKTKKKGVRINSNGFARIVTHSSLLAASERIAQDNTIKANEAEYSKRREEDWKAFKNAQVAEHDAWKAEKKRCKEAGVALEMTPPNPLVKKWEWKVVYPSFEGEMDVPDDEDAEDEDDE